WIGPAGLLTIHARRKARRFAEERRRARLKELRSKAIAGTMVNQDFADAVDILALPAFPMSRAEAGTWLKAKNVSRDQALSKLFGEAGERNPDFANVQSKSLLILPAWPLSAEDWDAIFGAPRLPQPSLADMQVVLSHLLDEAE